MAVLFRFAALLPPRQRLQAAALFIAMLFGAALEAVGVGIVLPFIGLVADPSGIERHTAVQTLYRFSDAGSPAQFMTWFGLALIVLYVVKNVFLGFRSQYGET